MRKDSLPREVAVGAFCGGGTKVLAEVAASGFERLRDVASVEQPLEVALTGGRAISGHWRVTGSVRGLLGLSCSRCLEHFDWHMQLEFDVVVVSSEAEEKRLLEETDTWFAEDGRLPLRQCVEDEILLALPLLPRCGRADCVGKAQF